MKVYGDYLLTHLKSAYDELIELEDKFGLDETGNLLHFSSDIELYEQLKYEINNLIGLLEVDEVRGNTAIGLFRENVLSDSLQDLFYRLVESGEYQRIWKLYDFDERVG